MNNIKTILISNKPLPYNNIGSWTSMYNNYLEGDHKIDYIICDEPEEKNEDVVYKSTNKSLSQRIYFKLNRINSNEHIFKIIASIFEPNTKYIIQFVDNFGGVTFISEKLNNKFGKENFYYQFFYHGYAPFFGNFQSRKFYESIDEMVLLTYLSYKEHIKYYTVLPCKFSILHNGVNSDDFKKINIEAKSKLRLKEGFSVDKKIFLWLSQDRPKKGLDFILNIWKKIDKNTKKDSEFWIIGSNRQFNVPGVKSIGRIPNKELPKYYQMTDVYLFPTLCQDGFGLSLAEALHCGCYPIASKLGGVPEVLQNGKFGKLIENPHFENEWKDEIEAVMLSKKELTNSFNVELYTLKTWNNQMNDLIEEAKKTLS